MTHQQLLKKYDSLAPAARKEVDQLMAKLASPAKTSMSGRSRRLDFGPGDEVFGMWKDREEMTDASAWVRDLRRREWGRRIGRTAD